LTTTRYQVVVAEPAIARFLFADVRFSWAWLVLRVWLGWDWLGHGLDKFENPAWMQTGAALQAFWTRAVAVPAPPSRPAVAYDWYREFLRMLLEGGHHVWFAKLVTIGEILIGVALILGLFTGIAAFFGVFMNWHFVMAGAASTNAMLMVVGVALMMAWRTAGWIGLDRWALPLVGTPWQRVAVPGAADTPAGHAPPAPSPS
jgi:thiosulfate dehydrogenase [quinone] large subunit